MKNEQGLREKIAEILENLCSNCVSNVNATCKQGMYCDNFKKTLSEILTLTEQASCESKPQMMSNIDDIMKIQLSDPSTKTDSYMQGLANGMIMIKSIITGDEPKFITIPKPQAEPDVCEWTMENEDSDTWATSCGEYFTLNEGTPKDNKMKFCCYCGKPISGKEKEEEI